jgi:predicted transcriptional regulator
MWYVKTKDVSPQEIRRQIEEALAAQGMSLDDLLRKLGYFKLKEGRERFEKLYAGEEDVQLLRRVSARLGIEHEALSGERVSTDFVEYLRFT